jgi:tetratricopeptide (TPR) repeat protein
MAPSLLGAYLAARHARVHSDLTVAADYYKRALARDPGNETLVKQAFVVEAADGNMARAAELASEVLKREPNYLWARIFLGVREYKAGAKDKAETHFKAAATAPVGELTGSLARAWVKFSANDAKGALEIVEGIKAVDSAQYFYLLHKGLIADLAGERTTARAAYDKLIELDPKGFRALLAMTGHLSRGQDFEGARKALQRYISLTQGGNNPLVKAVQADLSASREVPLLAANADQGLAEVFYSLGEQLAAEGRLDVGAMFLQIALDLRPGYENAQLMLASVQEVGRRFEVANATYASIAATSPLVSEVRIRQAMNLNRLERVDEAKSILDRLIAAEPSNIRPLTAAGDLMRAHKRFAEAVDYYTRAIKLIEKPTKQHSTYFYHRGAANERLKNWNAAEADLVRALELSPDDPLILNYLGYSWVDQNKNLKLGLQYIVKAVRLKKDDGYLVDSLGWAHYRLGDFKEAVKHLERACELAPQDPTINDHFGDSLWRVGRELEARFQWQQALSLKPEPEDEQKIRDKLVNGLPPLKSEAVPPPTVKRKETRRTQVQPRRAARIDRQPARPIE